MKRILCIVLCIIIMFGVSGCMSIGGLFGISMEEMETELLAYLREKYGEEFVTDKLVKEFNGNDGIYYRMVFTSEKRPDKGVLYCYPGEGRVGVPRTIGGEQFFIQDDYAQIILQTEYAEMLQKELGDDVMVKCQLHVNKHMLTQEEFDAGLKACLENADMYPQMAVFVFADMSRADGELKAAAEAFMGQYNAYRQYLYLAYESPIFFSIWEKRYYENTNNFENYLKKSEIERIEFSFFSLDIGLEETRILKG